MARVVDIRVDPPGLRGLNRLAARLNDMADLGIIEGWHLGRWADARKQAHQIVLHNAEDAELVMGQTQPEAAQ